MTPRPCRVMLPKGNPHFWHPLRMPAGVTADMAQVLVLPCLRQHQFHTQVLEITDLLVSAFKGPPPLLGCEPLQGCKQLSGW